MKKLILLSIILTLTSCYKAESIGGDYVIEQDWFKGDFTTWVWYKGQIVQSYTIDRNSVTKKRIQKDSIKAVNFIDCVKNGRNCKSDKENEITIKQGFMYKKFNTWIWYKGEILTSFEFDEDLACPENIKKDSLKAVKWIEKNKKFIKK